MANNYLAFSTGFKASPEQLEVLEEWYESEEWKELLDEPEHPDFRVEFLPTGPHNVWVYAEEFGNPEHAIDFIYHALGKIASDEIVHLGWAQWCSKPRIGEFGGGEAIITREGVHTPDWNWAGRTIQELNQRRADAQSDGS